MIARLGYEVGNQRAMQIVTDAMKLDPLAPTLIDARNSILAADAAGFGSDDEKDIWAGFATRGLGFGATMSAVNANGKESFDNPLPGMGEVTFTDCNSNGTADVGETLTLTVPLTNPVSVAVSSVSAQVQGGGSANYGAINPGQTVNRTINYQVPANAAPGSKITINIDVNSNLGLQTKTFVVTAGTPVRSSVQNFDGVAAPALPAGWSSSNSGAATAFVTSTAASDTAPNAASTTLAATTGTAQLLSAAIAIPATGSNQLTFRHSFNTEFEWDGAIVAMSINGGGFLEGAGHDFKSDACRTQNIGAARRSRSEKDEHKKKTGIHSDSC
jgi:hypothetical protein